jgi:pyrimidine deaminase RibD-like protein
MRDREVFDALFDVARSSKDPEGVVAAGLVKRGALVVAAASADDGVAHAEYLVIRAARARGIPIEADDVLYTTLEPCSGTAAANDGADCATWLIRAGVRHVVFAARDPEHSVTTGRRLRAAGVGVRQVGDPATVRRAVDLFNSTLRVDRHAMRLPRQDGLSASEP